MGLRLPRRVVASDGDVATSVRRVLTGDELGKLLAVCAHSTRVETMIRMSAQAGFRRGEAIGLRWPDIDLSARRVTVARSVWQERTTDGPVRHVRTPKSGKPRRVAIPRVLAERLAAWSAESVQRGDADARGHVWHGKDGGPMDDGTPNQALSRALERAGLTEPDGRGVVTWHGLRHSCASLMIAAAVPMTAVQRQLGHANPNITATIYAHLVHDGQLDDAVEAPFSE